MYCPYCGNSMDGPRCNQCGNIVHKDELVTRDQMWYNRAHDVDAISATASWFAIVVAVVTAFTLRGHMAGWFYTFGCLSASFMAGAVVASVSGLALERYAGKLAARRPFTTAKFMVFGAGAFGFWVMLALFLVIF